jgi:uncharacterized phiE125 gp8 family phage protein
MTLQTIASMREFLSLGPDVSEASVLEQYGAYLDGATVTPIVSLREAKAQLQREQDNTDDDAEITDFIADASAWVEGYTGHLLTARDVTEQFRGFGAVEIRAWPIAPAAVPGVAYQDVSGQPIAITDARLDLSSRPARVLPPSGPFYPFTDSKQLFTVTVRAGYESPNDVPREMRRAMLVMISAYDNDREGGDILAKAEASARRICGRLRLRRL